MTIEIVEVTQPAAGANFSWQNVLAGLKIIAIYFRLVTDANVATRELDYTVKYGALTLYSIDTAQTATAGVDANYRISNIAAVGGLNQIQLTTPVYVPIGGKFESSLTNIQVGDQYSNVRLVVEH